MKRQLPPLAAIRAFEAAARLMSFKQAAEELCLSPSAISHQVRALEDFLATQLFLRDGSRLELTLTGRTYLGKLTDLLNGLDDSTQAASARSKRELRVLCTPGFAARWLVPRLDKLPFGRDIRLRVAHGAPSTDFASNDADVVIHWADTPIPGAVVEPLMQTGRFPVASPEYLSMHKIDKPQDLLKHTLFHDEVMDGWPDWFDTTGTEMAGDRFGPCFAHCELSSTAAERGQGVALAYEAIVRGSLEAGTLVKLFSSVTAPVTIYSVAYPETRALNPFILDFRNWLFDEAQAAGCLPVRPALSAAE